MKPFVLALIFLLPAFGRAASFSVGLSSNDEATRIFSAKNRLNELQPKLVKVENSNMLVTFSAQDSARIKMKSVYVLFKEKMTADEFMEGLIKIFTLRRLGASAVTAVVPALLNNVKVIDHFGRVIDLRLEPLLLAAGATELLDYNTNTGIPRPLSTLEAHFPASRSFSVTKNVITTENHPELTKSVAKGLGLKQIAVDDYNQMLHTKVFFIAPSPNPSSAHFLRTLSHIQKMTDAGAIVHWVATDGVLYGRSDRSEKGRAAVARLIFDEAQIAGAQFISYVHPHSSQIDMASGVATISISSHEVINEKFRELGITRLNSPDLGAAKNTDDHASELGLGYNAVNYTVKIRSGSNVRIVGHFGASVKGERVGSVDDVIGSGKTNRESERLLQADEPGLIASAATHLSGDGAALFNDPESQMLVYVTNSYPGLKEKNLSRVVVLDLTPVLVSALRPYVTTEVENTCTKIMVF